MKEGSQNLVATFFNARAAYDETRLTGEPNPSLQSLRSLKNGGAEVLGRLQSQVSAIGGGLRLDVYAFISERGETKMNADLTRRCEASLQKSYV